MAVRYKSIDNEKVSKLWYVLLTDIRRKDKVSFNVNEGHRTIARQWELFRLNMHQVNGVWVPKPGRPITAFPSPSAPHIRTGSPYHAIDFNNAEGVRRAAARRGVTLRRTVLWPNGSVREEWHLEADPGQLKRYYDRRRRRLHALNKRIKKARNRLKKIQRFLKKLIGRR